jgi:anti-sigma B factor antagonist
VPLKRPSQLELQDVVSSGEHRLVLRGELDIASCPQLVAAVLRICSAGARVLVLDLSGVTFMGSTGLSAILSARGLCAKQGCELVLIPGPAQVQRLFELAGVLDRLPFGTPTATGEIVADSPGRPGTAGGPHG